MKYLILSLLLFSSLQGLAQKDYIFSTKNGAIRGYDPVAYFTEGMPLKGKKEFKFVWKGANWYFFSAANMQKFQDDPLKYAPQFGGYCAFAVSQGATASTDPEAWTIVDDKLYLNYSKSVRKKWLANHEQLIEKANQNWPGVLGK